MALRFIRPVQGAGCMRLVGRTQTVRQTSYPSRVISLRTWCTYPPGRRRDHAGCEEIYAIRIYWWDGGKRNREFLVLQKLILFVTHITNVEQNSI